MASYSDKQTLNDTQRLSISNYKDQLNQHEDPKQVTITGELSNGQQFEQVVSVTATACTYGGKRYWFTCPKCEARAAVLYYRSGYSCRKCTGLGYKTQLQRPLDRAVKRAETIRKALGWPAGIANGHGPKPRGMWASTFKALVYEHDKAAKEIMQHIKGGL